MSLLYTYTNFVILNVYLYEISHTIQPQIIPFSRWQIKPKNLDISNAEQALESALQLVASDLGTDAEYKIEASLYKLLLYEEGCFFARHRDNERLDGMFATLVLELPSEYEGAELSVWSPLTPNEKMTYTFNGGTSSTTKKRRTRSSNKPGLHFAAFYADCYHEVSELTSGHRAALIYHLTATPVQHPLLRHLRVPIPSPPQPADESVALRLSNMVDKFAQEADTDYPSTWDEGSLFGGDFSWPGAPKKLVVVLSHHYTPASFTSIKALKGSDRSIAELVRAAAFKPPNKDDLSSLARLAAKKVTEVGGQQYASASECLHAHQLVSDEFNGSGSKSEPFFDAAIALAVITDVGEGTNYPFGCEENGSTTSWTTGPLINLLTGEYCPLDLGPKKSSDMCADYHPSWFGGQDDQGPPYQYDGPVMPYGDPFPAYDMNGPVIYGEQVWPSERGNYSLPIYSHELLFASEEASTEYRKDAESNGKHVVADDSGVKKLEFRKFRPPIWYKPLPNLSCSDINISFHSAFTLFSFSVGNGMPYPGRQYSRAVIMIWPKAHREDIKMQAKGNKEVGM